MALIKPVNGILPKIGKDCFLAENATIVGEVEIGDKCSVWFQAVLRGDVNSITIGNGTNIQDGVIIHGTYKTANTIIGENVSIGHNAIIHGCTIRSGALVGMGAIVLDHAIIGEGSLIAAGSVVLSGTKVESNMVYGGIPAKPLKQVDERLRKVIAKTPGNYMMYASWFN